MIPFEAAVKEAGVASVMTSYNRINGPWAADSVDMIDTCYVASGASTVW